MAGHRARNLIWGRPPRWEWRSELHLIPITCFSELIVSLEAATTPQHTPTPLRKKVLVSVGAAQRSSAAGRMLWLFRSISTCNGCAPFLSLLSPSTPKQINPTNDCSEEQGSGNQGKSSTGDPSRQENRKHTQGDYHPSHRNSQHSPHTHTTDNPTTTSETHAVTV